MFDGSFREPAPEQMLEQSRRRIEELDPELGKGMRQEAKEALAYCDAEMERAKAKAEILEEYLACAFGPLA